MKNYFEIYSDLNSKLSINSIKEDDEQVSITYSISKCDVDYICHQVKVLSELAPNSLDFKVLINTSNRDYFSFPEMSTIDEAKSNLSRLLNPSIQTSENIEKLVKLEIHKKNLIDVINIKYQNTQSFKIYIFFSQRFENIISLDFLFNPKYNCTNTKVMLLFSELNNTRYYYDNEYFLITNDIDKLSLSESDLTTRSKNDSIIDRLKKESITAESAENILFPNVIHFSNLDTDIKSFNGARLALLSVISSIILYSCKVEIKYTSDKLIDYIDCQFNTLKHKKIRIESALLLIKNIDNEYILIKEKIHNDFEIIFNFFSEADCSSKLGIIKNLISLHIEDECSENLNKILNSSKSLLRSIRSNYLIYSKEKIDIWFYERSKTIDYFDKKTSDMSNIIEELSNHLNKTIISIIGIIIAGFIPYASSNNIFFLRYLFLLYSLFLPIIYIYQKWYTNVKFNRVINDFNNYIVLQKDLIDESELSSISNNRLNEMMTFYNSVKRMMLIFTITIETLLLVCFFKFEFLHNLIFNHIILSYYIM